MKFLHDLFKKNEHMFLKGGKLEKFYPLYEAQETFLFTPKDVTKGQVHVRDSLDSKRLMSMVIVALLPCILFGAYNTGMQMAVASGQPTDNLAGLFITGLMQILPIIVVSYVAGGVWEVLFAVVRKHEINEGFLVTGILFPLTLPPDIPLWQVAVGISFGVVIGKEIFGGTGMNVLNPALTARAFLYFAYPVQISGDKVWVAVDGFSAATPLAVAAGATDKGVTVTQALGDSFNLETMFYGFTPGSIGETSTLCCLIGAIVLIGCGVGSWRIISSVVGGTILTAFTVNALGGDTGFTTMTAWEHLCSGGLAFGLVFMATDPVSASRTKKAQYFYGFLIGLLTVLIRVFNPAYPEGTMLAILFMNIFSPLIDHMVVNANVKRRLNRVATQG